MVACRRPRLPGSLVVRLGLALSLAPRVALAETDIARAARLFKEGRAAMAAKDPATACPKFAEAQRLDPGAGTLLNLALCEEATGKLVAASEHLLAVAAQLPPDDERARYAASKANDIALKLPRLRLSLAEGAPEETAVARDGGEPIPVRRLGPQILIDAGEHTLVATCEGHAPRSHTVRLTPGEIQVLAVEPGPAHEAPPSPGWSTQKTLGFASMGVGGALLVVGIGTGIRAVVDKSTVNKDCPPNSYLCASSAGVDAASQGKTVAAVSTAGFVGGLAFAALGVGLVVADRAARSGEAPRTRASLAVGLAPGGFLCSGSF